MPGGGGAVRGGIQEKDYGCRTFIPGEAVGLDSLHGVQGVYGARVSVGANSYTAWEVIRGGAALGIHVPRCISAYLKYGLSNLWGTAEMSR